MCNRMSFKRQSASNTKKRTINFHVASKTTHLLHALCCFLSGCSKVSPAVSQRPLESPSPAPSIGSTTELRRQMEEITRVTNGPVGAAVALIEEGDVVAMNGAQRFPMQSVYKLPIGMAVLHQVDQGTLKLEQKVTVKPSEYVGSGQVSPLRDHNPRGVELSLGELLRYAVTESDGTASDVLLRVAGGAGACRSTSGLGIEGNVVTEKNLLAAALMCNIEIGQHRNPLWPYCESWLRPKAYRPPARSC